MGRLFCFAEGVSTSTTVGFSNQEAERGEGDSCMYVQIRRHMRQSHPNLGVCADKIFWWLEG